MKSIATISAAVAVLSGAADAFWRMECRSRSGLARIDPLTDPGVVSQHGHAIHGGSNFGMETTFEDLLASECTSCLVKEDNSAYWTPSLNFIHENGTTEIVPQIGGMLAYYLLFGEDIKAFPADFRMLAGDTRLRNFSGVVPDPERSLWGPEEKTQHALMQKALGFNCMNYAKDPEASIYRHFLPDKEYLDANCADGIRAEIFFPSCWNGDDNDSPNHRDHMAYPDLVNGGVCPEGFETRVPSIFFETIWDTSVFAGVSGQFVFANGDPTGYGYHGDFITGWDVDFLQDAVNTCTNPSGNIADCPLFTLQTEEEAAKCHFEVPEVLADDNCAGPAEGLCGNVPVQAGPGYAEVIKPGNEETPTGGYTPISTLAPTVPTLSFQTATFAATDKFGGGINVGGQSELPEEIDTGAVVVPAPTLVLEATQPALPQDPIVTPPAAPVVPYDAPAPVPTDAPVLPLVDEQLPAAAGSISSYTSDGVVYHVTVEEVTVYVTAEASAPAKLHRRHHHLHRRHHEHGLLGRY